MTSDLDNSALEAAIRAAVIATAKRPAGLRGPWVFDEAELQAFASRLTTLPTQQAQSTREAVTPSGDLCSDCPPVGYATDRTRCISCPRALTEKAEEAGNG